MAKKVVATLKTGTGKAFTKCIKMVKSEKTNAYVFKEQMVHNDHIKDFLINNQGIDILSQAFFILRKAFFIFMHPQFNN